MLSVLIPVYNFDVVSFVKDLAEQCKKTDIPFQIVCLDDFSSPEFKSKNVTLRQMDKVVYEELSENIGRSKIRNLLAEKAQYENLLFLDCDSKTNNVEFIANYVTKIDGKSVVYGGRNYEQSQPQNKAEHFRWWYGVNRETIDAKTRLKAPYCHFMTNNFCIPKSVYQQIKLDETIQGYGHEDTLFGIELRKNKIPILHIENPLCHIGLEGFETFIGKTEEGIFNLNELLNRGKVDQSIKLLRGYKLIKRTGLEPVVYAYFKKNKSTILKKLQKQKVNLKWFDSYKLGYLVSLRRSAKK